MARTPKETNSYIEFTRAFQRKKTTHTPMLRSAQTSSAFLKSKCSFAFVTPKSIVTTLPPPPPPLYCLVRRHCHKNVHEAPRASHRPTQHSVVDLSTLDDRFVTTLKTEFPSAIDLHDFVDTVSQELNKHGFVRENTICAVSTCRDENCRPLINAVEDRWGAGFSLTAMVRRCVMFGRH